MKVTELREHERLRPLTSTLDCVYKYCWGSGARTRFSYTVDRLVLIFSEWRKTNIKKQDVGELISPWGRRATQHFPPFSFGFTQTNKKT